MITPADSAPLPDDPTLEEIRAALIGDIAANAAFDGWSTASVAAAAQRRGLDQDLAKLALGDNAAELVDAWFADIDARMAEHLPPETLAAMSIRERITQLIEQRLTLLAPHREALRAALVILALPTNLVRATRLGWRAADAMWRLAGDTATDFNHYTKRTTLAAVYASTISVFLNDESDDWQDTRAFLGRRIGDVMRIEKAKAGWRNRRMMRFSPARFIGRLRYPAR